MLDGSTPALYYCTTALLDTASTNAQASDQTKVLAVWRESCFLDMIYPGEHCVHKHKSDPNNISIYICQYQVEFVFERKQYSGFQTSSSMFKKKKRLKKKSPVNGLCSRDTYPIYSCLLVHT